VDTVKLVGVVGEDFGADNLNILKSKGIDTSGIQIIEGGKSFFWSGRYHNDMNSRDTLVTELNVLADFDPIIPESYQDCDFLLLGNLTPQVQLTTLNRIKNKPKLIVLDTMNFWMDVALDDLKEVLQKIDVLTINDEEARQLSGEYALVKAAEKILAMGPKYLIIKKGEHGALLFGEGQIFAAPALPLAEVFDPTGAGDSFAGGFIGYLAQVDAINFAHMKMPLSTALLWLLSVSRSSVLNAYKQSVNKILKHVLRLSNNWHISICSEAIAIKKNRKYFALRKVQYLRLPKKD